MKRLPLILFAFLAIVGCSSKQPQKQLPVQTTKWEHFSGSWFEFDFPAYMDVDEIRNEISDTIPGLKEGGDVYLYTDYLPLKFKFTKSCMFDVFDNPEEWRDFSIEAKCGNLSDSEDPVLGILSTHDSIDFKGNHAASVTFAVLSDNDTIAHHQLVVMTKPSKNLYYINVMAPANEFEKYSEIIDSVFSSIVLK